MKTVQHLLALKAPGAVTIAPGASVFDALKLMADKDVGAVVVIDNGRVTGILSERDYARKVILHNKSSREIPVSEIMTERVLFVRPDQTLDECMALVTSKRIRHLPVLDGHRLVGVLSIGDLVKATISEQDFTIKQLESYITS
jgi:CBS domain-containing protein